MISDAGHRELDVAERQRAECRRERQRNRLREIGADQLVGAEPRVQEQQRDDHQRARADRGHPDDQTADDPDQQRRDRSRHHLGDERGARVATAAVEHEAQAIAPAPTSSAAPSARSMLVSAQLELPITCSRYAPANAAGTEPITIQPTSRRLTVPARRWTAAPIGRITTAATRSLRDRRRRRHAEQQDQHRRHQRAAAGAGHPDQQADDRAAENDVGIDVHVARLRATEVQGVPITSP